jgi:serine/threonine protein kinase
MFNPTLTDNQILLRNIKLIDFGFATKYRESKTGWHIAKKELSEFRGNIEFSSLNQMNFESPSRRDDLISLFYLLLCILNDFKYPLNSQCDHEIYKESELSDINKFQCIIKMK